jgi:hypothetical protein
MMVILKTKGLDMNKNPFEKSRGYWLLINAVAWVIVIAVLAATVASIVALMKWVA